MNKKLLCLLISSFLLSGCANFKKINANELAAERDAQKATEYAKKIRNNPVIQDSTKQWINTALRQGEISRKALELLKNSSPNL